MDRAAANLRREIRTFTMHAASTPDRVFPLLCPVREYEWIETWNCEMIRSNSGYAELDCVFKTKHGDVEELWTVSRYEPNAIIEFVVSSEFRIMRYRFTLTPERDTGTRIEIEQISTALSREGEKRVEDPYFEVHMKTMEVMLNHFLETGKTVSNEEAIRRVHG